MDEQTQKIMRESVDWAGTVDYLIGTIERGRILHKNGYDLENNESVIEGLKQLNVVPKDDNHRDTITTVIRSVDYNQTDDSENGSVKLNEMMRKTSVKFLLYEMIQIQDRLAALENVQDIASRLLKGLRETKLETAYKKELVMMPHDFVSGYLETAEKIEKDTSPLFENDGIFNLGEPTLIPELQSTVEEFFEKLPERHEDENPISMFEAGYSSRSIREIVKKASDDSFLRQARPAVDTIIAAMEEDEADISSLDRLTNAAEMIKAINHCCTYITHMKERAVREISYVAHSVTGEENLLK